MNIREILKGIDQTEDESEFGWWETSVGAEFGKNKLLEVEKEIAQFKAEKEEYLKRASKLENRADCLSNQALGRLNVVQRENEQLKAEKKLQTEMTCDLADELKQLKFERDELKFRAEKAEKELLKWKEEFAEIHDYDGHTRPVTPEHAGKKARANQQIVKQIEQVRSHNRCYNCAGYYGTKIDGCTSSEYQFAPSHICDHWQSEDQEK